MDSGLHPGIQFSHRSADVDETLSNLYFELGVGHMPQRRDPSQNTARDQAQCDAVRVVDNDHIIDLKPHRRSGRTSCLDRAAEF